MNITEALIGWYEKNKRPLPWRETCDPYKIWISEVILQQTRVEQGTSYYFRFLEKFPTLERLANASEQEVLQLWQGLGYYSRARNMHHTAQTLLEKHNGQFPKSKVELKKLKGIGAYTAAAIASLCFDEAVAVVDGNVERVLSRIFAVDLLVDTQQGKKAIQALANSLMDVKVPGVFNQAMMELGARVCTPRNPDCVLCPVSFSCEAMRLGQTGEYPKKSLKKPPTKRYLNYLVIILSKDNASYVLMRKRTGEDIWKNLYDFPCVETEQETDLDEVLALAVKDALFPSEGNFKTNTSEIYKHQLSHRLLLAKFTQVMVRDISWAKEGLIPIKIHETACVPLPRLIEKYWERELL